MTRAMFFAAGALLLLALWAGPLPGLARSSFTAHMTLHMGVVAVAAPLLALSLVRGPHDPAAASPLLFSALPAAALELAVVWGWHAPALHAAARVSMAAFVLEQGSFLAAGLLVWIAALGGEQRAGPRAGSGVLALLITSMHMTLLGALLALAPRPLYHAHASGAVAGLSPLDDQQIGGVVMLLVGGASYLAGGLALSRRMLLARQPEAR